MQFNRSNNQPPAVTAADEMAVAKIFALLSEISDFGQNSVIDALAEARAAVAEQANKLGDPIQQTFNQMKIDPIAKAVAPLVGMDIAVVRKIAYSVLAPSRAEIVLDVLRHHLAHLRPNLKLSTNGKRTAGRRRA